MSHGMVLQTAVSFFLGLSITLSMSGCGTEGYPENLTYPLRTDPLVIKLPEKQPDRPEPPGRFEQTILHLPELGGQILLPEKLTAAQRRTEPGPESAVRHPGPPPHFRTGE